MNHIYINNTQQNSPMQLHQNQDNSATKSKSIQQQFNNFNQNLFLTLRKKSFANNQKIKRSQHELANRLLKIQYESNRLKSILVQSEKQFDKTVVQISNRDKAIWTQSSTYFCNKFIQLEQLWKKQHHYNEQCKRKIEVKRREVQHLLKQVYMKDSTLLEYSTNTKVDNQERSIIKANKQNFKPRSRSMLTIINNESTLRKKLPTRKTQFNHHQKSSILINTPKQMASIPTKKSFSNKKLNSYLEPIKKVKMKQNSLLPLLKQLLIQYKPLIDENQRNWFVELVFGDRSLNKIIKYIDFHSNERNIKKILSN